MKILFLDQSGEPGGAELCLLDIAKCFHDRALVGLFQDGRFRQLLEQQQIPVQVLAQSIQVRKDSNWIQGLRALRQLLPLVVKVAQLSRKYTLIYANTQKALVVGALASLLSRRPLVYHLHDILASEHFSSANRFIAVTLANRVASLVIANSQATRSAFIEAGGRPELAEVVYNGFNPQFYAAEPSRVVELRRQLGLEGKFVVGLFSRLSPWKGQHVLLQALSACPEDVAAIFVGDALFGEQEYVQALQAQVVDLGLQNRVRFLGFRSDVVPLMHICDVITHTSIAPEPFGRVIVEAMLCDRPVIAAQAGGVLELVEPDTTGWLTQPGNFEELAAKINFCRNHPDQTSVISHQAQIKASQRFHADTIAQQLTRLLNQVHRDQHTVPNSSRQWRMSNR